ncbi:hypothetical protein ABIF65_000503 [Bradyrhizobium japonicum]
MQAHLGEGYVSEYSVWMDTPHPALRATFPHKGGKGRKSFGVRTYTVAPCAFALRRCSSRRGMISTKLQGRVR